jgi:hypothetical protein
LNNVSLAPRVEVIDLDRTLAAAEEILHAVGTASREVPE